MHKLFNLHLGFFFYVKKTLKNFASSNFFFIMLDVLDLILVVIIFNFFPLLFHKSFIFFLISHFNPSL